MADKYRELFMRSVIHRAVFVLLFVAVTALGQDDAALYYRRTHGGALPPNGVSVSDHSEESAATYTAPKFSTTTSEALLDAGINPTNLGKGDWIWQMPSCISALGV